MKEFEVSERDIIPKKLALKFNPPIIAFEYNLKSLKMDYLLQINLEDLFKIYDSAEEISKWIYKYYSDIISPKTIPEKQIIRLVERLLLLKKIDNKTGPKKDIFEPDDKRKSDESNDEGNSNFYKSDINFFDGSGSKKSRQDKYLSNENSDRDINMNEIKDVLKYGDRYGDSSSKEQNNNKNKCSDNLLDDFSVGSLNSIRDDTISNREREYI